MSYIVDVGGPSEIIIYVDNISPQVPLVALHGGQKLDNLDFGAIFTFLRSDNVASLG